MLLYLSESLGAVRLLVLREQVSGVELGAARFTHERLLAAVATLVVLEYYKNYHELSILSAAILFVTLQSNKYMFL